jgi:hypothetical protein
MHYIKLLLLRILIAQLEIIIGFFESGFGRGREAFEGALVVFWCRPIEFHITGRDGKTLGKRLSGQREASNQKVVFPLSELEFDFLLLLNQTFREILVEFCEIAHGRDDFRLVDLIPAIYFFEVFGKQLALNRSFLFEGFEI